MVGEFSAGRPSDASSAAPAGTAVGVDQAMRFVGFLASHPGIRRELVNATFPSRRQAAAHVVAKAGQMGYTFTVGDYKQLIHDVMLARRPTVAEKASLLEQLGAPTVTYLEVPYRPAPAG
jgi:hypothetical protein